MTKILVTRPEDDETTFYCSKWCKDIIRTAKDRGHNVIDFYGEKATKKKVEEVLIKQKPKLLLFNGHGDDKTIIGHNEEPLIEANVNDKLLKKTISHALTCNAAKVLGKTAVEKGAEAFVGYKEYFVFYIDKHSSSKPLSDRVAKPVLQSAMEVPLSLVNGRTVEESVVRAKKTYAYWVQWYLRHGEELEAPQNLEALLWNMQQLVAHGDLDSKI